MRYSYQTNDTTHKIRETKFDKNLFNSWAIQPICSEENKMWHFKKNRKKYCQTNRLSCNWHFGGKTFSKHEINSKRSDDIKANHNVSKWGKLQWIIRLSSKDSDKFGEFRMTYIIEFVSWVQPNSASSGRLQNIKTLNWKCELISPKNQSNSTN